jgi:hypothetical protein
MLKPYLIPFSLFPPCKKIKIIYKEKSRRTTGGKALKHKMLLNVKALPHSLLIVSSL